MRTKLHIKRLFKGSWAKDRTQSLSSKLAILWVTSKCISSSAWIIAMMCFELLGLSAVTKSFYLCLAKVYLATHGSEGHQLASSMQEEEESLLVPSNYSAIRGHGWRGNKCLSTFNVGTWVNKNHAETHMDTLKSGMLVVVLRGKKCFAPSFLRFLRYLWYHFCSIPSKGKQKYWCCCYLSAVLTARHLLLFSAFPKLQNALQILFMWKGKKLFLIAFSWLCHRKSYVCRGLKEWRCEDKPL